MDREAGSQLKKNTSVCGRLFETYKGDGVQFDNETSPT